MVSFTSVMALCFAASAVFALPNAEGLREGHIIRARLIPAIAQTHARTSIATIDPSGALYPTATPDLESRTAEKEEPLRRAFKDARMVRAGGLLRSPIKRRNRPV